MRLPFPLREMHTADWCQAKRRWIRYFGIAA